MIVVVLRGLFAAAAFAPLGEGIANKTTMVAIQEQRRWMTLVQR